jgi:hypothetical protein
MAIENIKKDLGGGGIKEKPGKKDTSAFGGDSVAIPEERRAWLRRHANEVFEITRGRVTQSKLNEYERKLAASKWGPYIEKYKHEPERIKRQMAIELGKAKTDAERADIKENIEVARRMFGWGKK